MTMLMLFDGLLLVTVVVCGYRAIHAPALFTSVVLYIAFGLLLSLVWVRLGAPDIAIAEAAIGAGVTGALLLDTAGRIGARSSARYRLDPLARRIAALALVGMAATLSWAMITVSDRSPSLRESVNENLSASGAEHPVTAVLLDFRGFDTFLEVTVLLVAGVAVLALRRGLPLGGGRVSTPDAVAAASASITIPIAVVVAGYLIWRGAYAPGGAFQAGAVLGAAAVLFLLTRFTAGGVPVGRLLWSVLAIGTLTFLGAGGIGLVRGDAFLDHPERFASAIILVIELAVALSVAATLGLLFLAAEAGEGSREAGL
jgi:multisubunit Na+/H+ antiporter MnhB subunit